MIKRVSYDSQYRASFDYPFFKVSEGERARIILIEPEPLMALTHWVDTQGSFVCLGDYDKVMASGFDENCPFCMAAQMGKDSGVRRSTRRFVTHILKYITRRDANPIEPTTVETQLWRFGEDKFSQLISAAETYKDLRKFDLVVKCVDDTWQRYDIQVVGNQTAVYLTNKEITASIIDQFKKERLDDLAPFLGKSVTPAAAQELVDRLVGTTSVRTPNEDDMGLLEDLTRGNFDAGTDEDDSDSDTIVETFSLDDLLG